MSATTTTTRMRKVEAQALGRCAATMHEAAAGVLDAGPSTIAQALNAYGTLLEEKAATLVEDADIDNGGGAPQPPLLFQRTCRCDRDRQLAEFACAFRDRYICADCFAELREEVDRAMRPVDVVIVADYVEDFRHSATTPVSSFVDRVQASLGNDSPAGELLTLGHLRDRVTFATRIATLERDDDAIGALTVRGPLALVRETVEEVLRFFSNTLEDQVGTMQRRREGGMDVDADYRERTQHYAAGLDHFATVLGALPEDHLPLAGGDER